MVTPHLVILGGSLSPTSRADRIAAWCARDAVARSAVATCFRGADLEFGFYRPDTDNWRDAGVRRYLEALARADGIVLVSPAYHGTVSGLLKNALDFVNELARAPEPFLDDRPIGCVAVASGDQGAHSTLATLRTIAHALRGWPTPLGLALSGERAAVNGNGEPASARTVAELSVMLDQVLGAARRHADGARPRAIPRLPQITAPSGVSAVRAPRRT